MNMLQHLFKWVGSDWRLLVLLIFLLIAPFLGIVLLDDLADRYEASALEQRRQRIEEYNAWMSSLQFRTEPIPETEVSKYRDLLNKN